MRSISILITVIWLSQSFLSCNKTSQSAVAIASFSPETDGPGGKVYVKGRGFGNSSSALVLKFNGLAAEIKTISDTFLTTIVPDGTKSGRITISAPLGTASSEKQFNVLLNSGSWNMKADFAGQARTGAASFSIGSKGYIATGFGTNQYNDLFEYDPVTNAWTQKSSIPGPGREETIGFAIGNKGYVFTGISLSNNLADVWEYDPSTNIWTRKSNFPGGGRYNGSGFSINNKGYLGLGIKDTLGSQQVQLRDWWEYDPLADSWVQKNDFPGGTRSLATAFSTNGKGYLALGVSGNALVRDWWQYDAATDHWIKMGDFPGTARYAAVGFGIGTAYYIGNGGNGGGYTQEPVNDWWAYENGSWERKTSQSEERYLAVAFVINGIAYISTGFSNEHGNLGDLWMFNP